MAQTRTDGGGKALSPAYSQKMKTVKQRKAMGVGAFGSSLADQQYKQQLKAATTMLKPKTPTAPKPKPRTTSSAKAGTFVPSVRLDPSQVRRR